MVVALGNVILQRRVRVRCVIVHWRGDSVDCGLNTALDVLLTVAGLCNRGPGVARKEYA